MIRFERRLFINQIFLAKLLKFEQVILPVERDAVWVFAFRDGVIRSLIGENVVHLLGVELLRTRQLPPILPL